VISYKYKIVACKSEVVLIKNTDKQLISQLIEVVNKRKDLGEKVNKVKLIDLLLGTHYWA
jgi:cell division protein FtsL